jgi:hypothetical protein
MLIPLTRQQFEVLIPAIATGAQYRYIWGKPQDVLKRILISAVGGALILIISRLVGDDFRLLNLCLGITVAFYWLWDPILWASLRNANYRRYPYCGFWRGEVLDFYITDEVISTKETVDKRGKLVLSENREKRLNVEVGDETGFSTRLQIPLKRDHNLISRGLIAEMLVLSSFPDLRRISQVTDIYLPECRLWVSDYPYLRKDTFQEVSDRLQSQSEPPRRQRSRRRSR